jgi:hypothetical protein
MIPSFHPDGRRVIFASNHTNPRSRTFDLPLINLDIFIADWVERP